MALKLREIEREKVDGNIKLLYKTKEILTNQKLFTWSLVKGLSSYIYIYTSVATKTSDTRSYFNCRVILYSISTCYI